MSSLPATWSSSNLLLSGTSLLPLQVSLVYGSPMQLQISKAMFWFHNVLSNFVWPNACLVYIVSLQ
jgi:hypothetical protein